MGARMPRARLLSRLSTSNSARSDCCSELEECCALTTRQCQCALERGLTLASVAGDEQQPAMESLEFGACEEIPGAIGDEQSVRQQFAGTFMSTKGERRFGNRADQVGI